MPARLRCRASQASCFSLSEIGAATSTHSLFRPPKRGPRTTLPLGELRPARGLGPDLVAADDAAGAIARVQDEGQAGGDEPQERLQAVHARELGGTAVGHGARLYSHASFHRSEWLSRSG